MMLQDKIAAGAAREESLGRKRARVEEAPVDPPAAAAPIIEPTAPNAKMSLRDALARTFENI